MLNYNGKSLNLSLNSYVNDRIIIKDFPFNYPKFRKKVFYKCDICNEEFLTGNSIRENYRKICPKHHFYYICDFCHQEFEITCLSDFVNSDKKERFCSNNCALQFINRSDKMKQAVIMMNKNRVKENLIKIQICKKCGKNFNSIFKMDICNACITSNTNYNNLKKDQICIKCNKIFHSTFIMNIGPCCNPNIRGISKFQNNNHCYIHPNEHKTYLNECWSCYKEKFKNMNINFSLPDDFEIYPTFRKQDSQNWNDAKQAFEQNLVDNGIKWFTYIKFYINEEN